MVSCMVSLECVSPMYSPFYVRQPCMATVYGPCMVPCMVVTLRIIFLGRAPRKTLRRSGSIDHTQESRQPTIRKPSPRDHTRNTPGLILTSLLLFLLVNPNSWRPMIRIILTGDMDSMTTCTTCSSWSVEPTRETKRKTGLAG